MRTIVEHRRQRTVYVAEGITAYDDEGYPGGCDVLLCTTIDQVVLSDIYLTGEDIGGHITHQACLDVWVIA